MAAFSMIISMISYPLMMAFANDLFNAAGDEEAMRMMFESGLFNNLIWIDIVSDTLLYGGLIAAIWFRIKTLKH
jgi:TfoX/Sxy family transcriptional regulator of competence genes